MANQSIYKAFERMWAHIVSTFVKKTDVAEIFDGIDAVTIDIDDAAEGTAMGIDADTFGGYNIDQFLRKNDLINADQLSGYNIDHFLRKNEEINADTFNNHTIDYFITKPEAGEVLSDAMLKTGGEFVGNVTQSAGHRFDFKSLNGAKLRIIGYTDSDTVALQAIDNQGNWITDILTIDSATGAILGGGLMPKSGGYFTGEVYSTQGTSHPATGCFRNIEVWNSANNAQVSTGLIHMVRK